ncbi:hypothetical protein [Pseudarthrobacter sp. NS4]|uniref:hypothetical protein n=1 Tax=Pseudarthrobacter sp. NS4 TaxID=2973976 RepID=UPI002163E88E|nr:hypothetical protein [Pseudarthrobacter sp. NS4]
MVDNANEPAGVSLGFTAGPTPKDLEPGDFGRGEARRFPAVGRGLDDIRIFVKALLFWGTLPVCTYA